MGKKIISLLLAFLLVCTIFAGCNPNEQPAQNIGEDVPDGTNPPDATQTVTIDSVFLNYFYIDAITNQYAQWENTYGNNTHQYLTNY